MKPTKKLALEFADMLELSALEPGQDLDWNDVREVIAGLTEDQLDSFRLGLLTDWTHAIATKRLSWRRGRPAGKLLVL
jgi:hypothetical protein